MSTTRTIEYGEYGDLLEAISKTAIEIRAIGQLVAIAGYRNELTSEICDGVGLLFDFKSDELKFIESALRNEIREIRTNKLEIRDPDRIAEWAGVSQHAVNRVISIATGINLGPPTPHHSETPPYVYKKPVDGLNEAVGEAVAPANKPGVSQ